MFKSSSKLYLTCIREGLEMNCYTFLGYFLLSACILGVSASGQEDIDYCVPGSQKRIDCNDCLCGNDKKWHCSLLLCEHRSNQVNRQFNSDNRHKPLSGTFH